MRGGLELRVDGLVKREASQVRIYAFKVRIYKAIASIGYFSPSLHYRDDHVMGCTRGRNVKRGTKGFRVRKTGLSSTLITLRYE